VLPPGRPFLHGQNANAHFYFATPGPKPPSKKPAPLKYKIPNNPRQNSKKARRKAKLSKAFLGQPAFHESPRKKLYTKEPNFFEKNQKPLSRNLIAFYKSRMGKRTGTPASPASSAKGPQPSNPLFQNYGRKNCIRKLLRAKYAFPFDQSPKPWANRRPNIALPRPRCKRENYQFGRGYIEFASPRRGPIGHLLRNPRLTKKPAQKKTAPPSHESWTRPGRPARPPTKIGRSRLAGNDVGPGGIFLWQLLRASKKPPLRLGEPPATAKQLVQLKGKGTRSRPSSKTQSKPKKGNFLPRKKVFSVAHWC